MQRILILLFVITSVGCFAQDVKKHNLGFENKGSGNMLSDGWQKWGNYSLSIDSVANSGNSAGKITSDSAGSSFGSIAYSIPAYYKGKKIRLEGYMKTKAVAGYAGLLLRVDGPAGPLAFDNMEKQKISGTNDWKKYSITLDYPETAELINAAGILVGQGEAWFDDFVIFIDNQDIELMKEEKPGALLDTTYHAGSKIEMPKITPQLLDNLELLGRVWGFLKYHHPVIAQGNQNWDYALFRFLPDYLDVKDTNTRNKLLETWIADLGPLSPCTSCKPVNNAAKLKPDLEWINTLDPALQTTLKAVYNGRFQGKQFYIDMAPGVGNPIFKNEAGYKNMQYPDAGFRLLTIYRYWNMIHYFFPYKHLTDKNWNQVLKDYLPAFLTANDELAYEMAALQLVEEVKDSHATLWNIDKVDEWKGNRHAPLHMRFVQNKLVVMDYYLPDLKPVLGLERGDVITAINNVPVAQLVKEKKPFFPASNEPTRLKNMANSLLRSNESTISVTVLPASGEEKTMNIPLFLRDSLKLREWYNRNKEKSFKMLDDNIGYITLENIKAEDIEPIKNTFLNAKGIIIDIRNYPATFVPFLLGNFFVSHKTPFVKFTRGNLQNPGEFVLGESLTIPGAGKTFKGKLVVLVNEDSQSQSEYTAMAFKAGDNTTIVGSTTAGADGNVSYITLPGGLETMISGIGVYYPDGTETQRVGIVPDIIVSPTIEGIRKNKDEVLEKAIEIIKQETKR